jgi:hypothetical protein
MISSGLVPREDHRPLEVRDAHEVRDLIAVYGGQHVLELGGVVGPGAVARSRHLPGSGGVAYTLTQYPAEERQPGSWEGLGCLSSCFSVLYFYSRAARSAPTRRSDSTGAWRLAERRGPLWPPWL